MVLKSLCCAAALLAIVGSPASGQVYQPAMPSTITTINSGNMSFSNGMVNGQSYNSTSQQIGNMTITNGMVDGQPFHATTTTIGPTQTTTVTP